MIADLTFDNDSFRFVLVASIAIAFLVYTRLRLVAGGSVTGGFIAGLLLLGEWQVAIWVFALAFATALLVRVVVLRFLPLTRTLVFQTCVLTGALIGIAIIAVADVDATSGTWGVIVAYGALVTPGLTAYDLLHQGPGRTIGAIGAVTVATLVVTVPVLLLAADLPQGISAMTAGGDLLRLTSGQLWLATIAAIALGIALRLTTDLRSGGFLGALFLAELLTWEAFATVAAGAITTAIAMRLIRARVVLSPRQAAQVALVLGALVAWAGLYWLSAAGWDPAIAANALRVAPLLAVGLIAADMGRHGSSIPRTIVGVGVATALIVLIVAIADAAGMDAAIAVLAVVTTAIAAPGAVRLARRWRNAVTTAEQVALAEPRTTIGVGAPGDR